MYHTKDQGQESGVRHAESEREDLGLQDEDQRHAAQSERAEQPPGGDAPQLPAQAERDGAQAAGAGRAPAEFGAAAAREGRAGRAAEWPAHGAGHAAEQRWVIE